MYSIDLLEDKMNIFKQFCISIYKFSDYAQLLYNRKRTVICYFLLLALFAGIIELLPACGFIYSHNGISGIVEEYVHDFYIKDGKLSCDTYDVSVSEARIYIDTINDFEPESKVGDEPIYFIANSTEFIYSNGVAIASGKFSDYGDFSKEKLLELVSSKKFIVALISASIISTWIAEIFMGIFSVIFLALVGNLINTAKIQAQVTFSELHKIAVYARTFPVMLSSIFALFGLNLNIIIVVGLMITYMYLGLKSIKKGKGIIIAEL